MGNLISKTFSPDAATSDSRCISKHYRQRRLKWSDNGQPSKKLEVVSSPCHADSIHTGINNKTSCNRLRRCAPQRDLYEVNGAHLTPPIL
ncbi:unnamed protein product [Dicrocoelium dendriticum]|nr:unnamed protein product [Dicrocoelium dendriticum]